MSHVVLTVKCKEEQQEMLIALLGAQGVEGFQEKETGFDAYVETQLFEKVQLGMEETLLQFEATYTKALLAEQNWNALWESNFDPISWPPSLGIRASFHEALSDVEHEIIIDPKMAFGTGHHETTKMVCLWMKEFDFRRKSVFDFGTGTGILSIWAEKLGATSIHAVDYDEWSVENTKENIVRNNCGCIRVERGSIEKAQSQQYDFVLANINRNVILKSLAQIFASLSENGTVLLSGIMEKDNEIVKSALKEHGYTNPKVRQEGQWLAICL